VSNNYPWGGVICSHFSLTLSYEKLSRWGCVVQARIVILSGHSLFTEGVASRLRQYPQRVDVLFFDPQHPDYIDRIQKIRPAAVILDAADTDNSQCCLLCDLLIALPNLMIVRLEAQKPDIQIVKSSHYHIDEVRDIIDIIEQIT
jgi:DNA-binding NarL/FixJ family response regulator